MLLCTLFSIVGFESMTFVIFSQMSEEKDGTKETEETPLRIEGEEAEEDLRYGWGTFRPRALQCLNNPKVFVAALALFTFIQGNSVNIILALLKWSLFLKTADEFSVPGTVSNPFSTDQG